MKGKGGSHESKIAKETKEDKFAHWKKHNLDFSNSLAVVFDLHFVSFGTWSVAVLSFFF